MCIFPPPSSVNEIEMGFPTLVKDTAVGVWYVGVQKEINPDRNIIVRSVTFIGIISFNSASRKQSRGLILFGAAVSA
jgi:hypothetical protein